MRADVGQGRELAVSAAPRLPALNEFTPNQLGSANEIYWLLQLVASGSDREFIVEEIRERWFGDSAAQRADGASRLEQQRKRATNVIAGMRQAGLLDKSRVQVSLSPLGREVLSLEHVPSSGLEVFARFLLQERHGIELLQVARTVLERDGTAKKRAVDDELKRRGYAVPTNSSYSGKLRQWLAAVGVVDEQWRVDEAVLLRLTGIDSHLIIEWRSLSPLQQTTIAVIRARWTGNQTPITSPELVALLVQRGAEFDAGQLNRDIYKPLVAGGWIEHEVKPGGRGGKGGKLRPTDKALYLDVDLIDRLRLGVLPIELQNELTRPIAGILADLMSPDTHTKGIALELLALRLASECGLFPVDFRQRGVATGGAEVDLVVEGAHLHFSRWLFQCKNQTSPVSLSVLAKELGMATMLKAQVVVIVTTGTFAQSVLSYARQAAETTAVQIVLLDGASLRAYRESGGSALRAELHARALDALSLKRPQLAGIPRDSE